MPQTDHLEPKFVEHIPDLLEPGFLYVSIGFATTAHLCACGCKSEVIAPLSPTDWKMTYDGVNVSLHPSIGNWSLPCRSHYVLSNGRVRWASEWSDEQIALGRQQDLAAKNAYFSMAPKEKDTKPLKPKSSVHNEKEDRGVLSRLLAWLRE